MFLFALVRTSNIYNYGYYLGEIKIKWKRNYIIYLVRSATAAVTAVKYGAAEKLSAGAINSVRVILAA